MMSAGSLRRRFGTDYPLLQWVVFLEVLFLALPTLIILVASFGGGDIITFPPENLSAKWYVSLLSNQDYIDAFANSVLVATFCTALAIPAGVLTAVGLNRYDIRFENTIRLYLLLPFTIPLVVSGVILLILFGRLGWINQLWAVGLALTVINLPFMIWSVSSSVNGLDPMLENAARNLGAGRFQTFLHVTLPAILPGIISGSLLMFILGLNEFVVSLIITTPQTRTLPVQIYSAIRGNISPEIAAVSSIYVVIAIVAILVADRTVGLDQFLES